MYNFFVNDNQIQDNEIRIIGQDAKHIHSVLRMKKEDEIYVCNKDTSIKYLAKIKEIQKDEILCTIIEKEESTESNIKISLFQGLPKSDKMEYIIQKAVELGVYEIIPLEMKNCIAKLKDEDKKISRWQAISEAAAKQSKRNIIPKIKKMQNIKSIEQSLKEFDLVVVAYEDENKTTMKNILQNNKNAEKIAIIVGPEGGIDIKEIEILKNYKCELASLGKRILRTETASLAMLSMILYEYEL